ncbi:hypothetical protein VTI74DRAFT_260 [Chaetomium olivicolor]
MLMAIFSLGFFTVIISIIRIRYLKLFEDFPWETVDSSLWSIGELTSAITCACLPTLRPLLVRYFPSFASQIGRSTGGYGSEHRHGMLSRRNGVMSAALETGLDNRGPKTSISGGKTADDGTVSMTGSEVGLARRVSRSNPFEVHVVRELRVGVERQCRVCSNLAVKPVTETQAELPSSPKNANSMGREVFYLTDNRPNN